MFVFLYYELEADFNLFLKASIIAIDYKWNLPNADSEEYETLLSKVC